MLTNLLKLNLVGRNFLIPKGYAVLATASKKAHEEMVRQKSHKENKMVEDAQAIADKLADLTPTILTKAGEKERFWFRQYHSIIRCAKKVGLI